MRDIFRVRVKTKTGEIEIEGNQLFIEKKMEKLPALVQKMDRILAGEIISTTNKKNISESKTKSSKQTTTNTKSTTSKKINSTKKLLVPHTFKQWYAKFPNNLRQADALLIASYFIQHRSADNVFKDFLAKNTLEKAGISLSSVGASINRLVNEQFVIISKKMGKLALYKVSAKGRNHLIELIKEE